jgi:hypothetical protein
VEAAVEAAGEAYRKYLDVFNEVAANADADLSRLRDVATDEYADEVAETLMELRSQGKTFRGDSTFDEMQVFERWSDGGLEFVSTYVCFVATDSRVIDRAGVDVTPPDRIDRRPAVIRFRSADASDPSRLVPRGSDPWTGDIC